MCGDDNLRPGVRERLERRDRRNDAARISDRTVIQRHVEIGAHQHAAALHPVGQEVGEGEYRR